MSNSEWRAEVFKVEVEKANVRGGGGAQAWADEVSKTKECCPALDQFATKNND